MWKGKKISVVLPAYNEEENVQQVIQDFLREPFVDEVLVVDNSSTDRTAERVAQTPARLVRESRRGYGYALQRGMREAGGDLIVLCEPDGTFLSRDTHKLLAYAEDFDLVLGTRTTPALIWKGANMGWLLKWPNYLVAKFLEFLFNGPSLTDVGCTYRLIHRGALQGLLPHFRVGGSHFSPEMMMLAILKGLRVVEIPVNYAPRVGSSKITGKKWKAAWVGLRMILMIFRCRMCSWFGRV